MSQRKLKREWLETAFSSFLTEFPDKPISKNRLISEFCLAFDTTTRTAKELIKIFEDTDCIKIEGDLIWVLKKS